MSDERRRKVAHELAVLEALNGADPYPELAGIAEHASYPDLDADPEEDR